MINSEYNWHHSDDVSRIPVEAVIAGHDADGNEVFVARTLHENNHIAASVTPNRKLLSAIHEQQPVEAQSFEVHFHQYRVVILHIS
jgi:Protein of unknown function (DUF3421)